MSEVDEHALNGDLAERVEHHENHSKYDLPCHWLDPAVAARA
jgi:hypothetical protein